MESVLSVIAGDVVILTETGPDDLRVEVKSFLCLFEKTGKKV
jgi:hypothetical protein